MADLNDMTPDTAEQEVPAGKSASKKAKKAAPKDKKPNIFVRMGKRIKKFFRDYISEMKKVVWLSRKETMKSTLVVVVAVVALAIVIGLVDTGLEYGVQGLRELGRIIGLR